MDCMNDMNVVTTSDKRIATPVEIATLAGAQVWAYLEGDHERFKFKFGAGAWTPPFAADEAIQFLNEEMAKAERTRPTLETREVI